jgi:spore germination protein PB
MNFYIQQSIQINSIRIGSITNSSVLQIGSSGVIRPQTYLYNTGGFKGPAPETQKGTSISNGAGASVVPLQAP